MHWIAGNVLYLIENDNLKDIIFCIVFLSVFA
jgi:hypothetical protein